MLSVFFCYMLIMVKKYGNVWYMMKYEPFLFHIISKTIHKTKNWDVGQDIRTWCNPGLINCVGWLVGYGLPSRQCHIFLDKNMKSYPPISKLAVYKLQGEHVVFFYAGKHSQIRESSKQGIWPLEVRFPTFLFVWLPCVTFFGCGQHHKSQQDKGCNAPKV